MPRSRSKGRNAGGRRPAYHRLGAGVLLLGLGCTPEAEPPPPLRTGPTRVSWFTSADGVGWERQDGILAEHFVSLGLSVRPDGTLWVSGIDQSGKERGWWDRNFGDPTAGGLVFDGETWTRAAWPIEDEEAPALLDPQWQGDQLWYVARSGGAGDPAELPVRIRSAPPARTRLEGPGITDPSPVVFRGEQHLFVSQPGKGVVQYTGEPLSEVQHWARFQVPSALVMNDELWLLVQGNVRARRQPLLARSQDGRHFSEFQPVLPWDAVEHCTSPVMGPHPKGGLVLLCVEESPPERAP